MNPERPDRPGFTDPNRMESGGGGLVSTTHDYARFVPDDAQQGRRSAATSVLKPETVDLMSHNHIGELGIYSDGTTANPGRPGQKFGLDFAVYDDPAAGQTQQGKGTYYWGGAAGTWFWIDPVNDVFFVGMIQSHGRRSEAGRHELPRRVRQAGLRRARRSGPGCRRAGSAGCLAVGTTTDGIPFRVRMNEQGTAPGSSRRRLASKTNDEPSEGVIRGCLSGLE